MTPQQPKSSFRRLVPLLGGVAIVVVVVLALIWFVRSMREKPEGPKRQVAQVVKLIRPPPPPEEPPPPPPPPEEKIEEPLPQESPEDAPPDDAAPAEQLGLDAEGVAGSDGFGLAARKGGRELGLGGAVFGWYTGRLKDAILDQLSEDEQIRRRKYQVTVAVWVGTDGKVQRIALKSTTGDAEVDSAIERRLERELPMQDPPPLEMPQPVTLRIVSR